MLTYAWIALWALAPMQERHSRAELGRAFLDFEEAWRQHRPQGEKEIARFNRELDSIVMHFFSGRLGAVTETVRRLDDELRGRWPRTPERQLLTRLRPRVDPPVAALDSTESVHVRIASGDAALETAAELLVLVRNGEGRAVASWSTALGAGSPLVFEELARLEGWTLGRYALEARLGAERRELLRFSVVPRPLRETKRDFEARLGAAEGAFGEDDSLRAAARDVRARIDLLSDRPSEVDTTEFLLDPLAHCLRLEEELVALERGEDPWRGRAGDWWRVIGLGGSIVPYRVHAPEAVQGGEPLPLVIAFHGAGGDENMFMDAYGDGELARLAERHGFVAISPRAGLFSGNPVIFDRLVDAAADDWPIDPARIYVIGHSMGTGPTATLSRLRGTRIAACCCLSGAFSLRAFDDMAPMLMITGELDGIVSAGSVRNAHARAERAGAPVELRVEPHYGHTLIVGDVLAEVVDWLLRHRLGDG